MIDEGKGEQKENDIKKSLIFAKVLLDGVMKKEKNNFLENYLSVLYCSENRTSIFQVYFVFSGVKKKIV